MSVARKDTWDQFSRKEKSEVKLEAQMRSLYVPANKRDLFKKVEIMTDVLGVALNAALLEGLKLWFEKNEATF